MTPAATDFDLPQHIMDQITNGSNGVTTQVNRTNENPAQYEVLVFNASGSLIYTCPHPCKLKD